MTLAGTPMTAQVQRLGCSLLLCLLVFLSSAPFTVSSLSEGHPARGETASSLGPAPEELCTISALPAFKFIAVAGIGFVAGGALTIHDPLTSALLHGL